MNRIRRGFCAAAVALACACARKTENAARLDSFPVRVAVVRRGAVEDALTVVGSLRARDEATLFSRIDGKLVENLVKEGDPVRKGQPVALVQKDEVGVRYEPAPVPSTLDGVVGRTYLDRGADVTLATPVALVVDARSVRARADVPERYAARVRPGLPASVQVEAWPGRTFRGVVTKVSPVVDSDTRSSPVEVELDNADGRLRSGMFATIKIAVARREGVLVLPREALLDGEPASVFVVENGVARRRVVKLGLANETDAEVVSGLEEGARAVVFGLYGLKDGSPVDILAPPDAGAAEAAR